MKNEFTKEKFGETLRTLRRKKELTQQETARRLGVSASGYSRWETGEAESDRTMLARLAEVLDVSPAVFFGGDVSGNIPAAMEILYEGLRLEQRAERLFSIQYHALDGMLRSGVPEEEEIPVPPHYFRTESSREPHCRMYWGCRDFYTVFCNGPDVNMSMTLMPNREKYGWLHTERARIAALLAMLSDEDSLRCLFRLFDESFSRGCQFTAEYLGKCAGVSAEAAAVFLERMTQFAFCTCTPAHIGERVVSLYTYEADHLPVGILTLAYLALPERRRGQNSTSSRNCPAWLTVRKEEET